MIRANLKTSAGGVIPEGSYLVVNGTTSSFGTFTDSITESSMTGSILINVSNLSSMSWTTGNIYNLIAFNDPDHAANVDANPTSPVNVSNYDYIAFFTNTALTLSFS